MQALVLTHLGEAIALIGVVGYYFCYRWGVRTNVEIAQSWYAGVPACSV